MYFPVRWPRYVALDGDVLQVSADNHRRLFAVLQDNSLTIWVEKWPLPLWCHRRSLDSLESYGSNARVVWRRDSSAIAVVTCKQTVLFFQVDGDAFAADSVYEQKQILGTAGRENFELYLKDKVYPVRLALSGKCSLVSRVSALLSFRDELLVAQDDGRILRLTWDGEIQHDLTIDLNQVKFASEIFTWRNSFTNETYEAVDVQYLSIIGSLSIVFANGRAGVLMATTNRFSPGEVQGVWILDVTEATCTAVNHRYRLLAYGCNNSEGVVYHFDDATCTFAFSHKFVLSDKDFPDVHRVAGRVTSIQWTPDNAAVAVAWERCGLAVWSVFGSLIFCSLNWESPYCLLRVCAMEWGLDGYNLWMGTGKQELCLLGFMRAAATLNPASQCDQQNILLQGATSILISSRDALGKNDGNGSSSPWVNLDSKNHSYNKHWVHTPVPLTYLALNAPIRLSCIDRDGHNLCVAGRYGFCIYSLQSKKWKFFGNETQEQDFAITGGLLWWSDYIICGCVNLKESTDEIRIYPREERLDSSFAFVERCEAHVLHLSTCEDKLLAFKSNSHITIYIIQRQSLLVATGVHLVCVETIDVSSWLPHCLCVISATLTNLSVTTIPAYIQKRPESILLNVCGKLYLLQQDVFAVARRPTLGMISSTSAEIGESAYSQSTVLASAVENVWISCTSYPKMPHLTQALYIACGAAGMQIWLPLFPTADKQHNFMSKRIMLAIKLHTYPLAVLFNGAIVLGAESDVSTQSHLSLFPNCIVSKTSQVCLHPIINKLLVRNLGAHAWQIANSCSHLPYFNHSLELLLHEVLEEEANSSCPTPDALLPRVIDFIREFPVFLTTVVQCARKTELALWPHLFSAVGNPKDLFQECILQGQLETATSYLLVLQNLEVALVSRQHATILLGSALDVGKWQLAKDIIRFLKAIDPADVESPPRASLTPALLPTSMAGKASCPKSGLSSVVPLKPDEDITLMMASMIGPPQNQISRQRLCPKSDLMFSLDHRSLQPKLLPITCREKEDAEVINNAFVDKILARFARKLLQAGQLRKFGFFVSQVDFNVEMFLLKERHKAAKIEDFISALKNLHRDFELPLPAFGLWCGSLSQNSTMGYSQSYELTIVSDGTADARCSSMASDSGFTSVDGALRHTPPLGSPGAGLQVATAHLFDAASDGENAASGVTHPLHFQLERSSAGDQTVSLTTNAAGADNMIVQSADSDSLCISESGSCQFEHGFDPASGFGQSCISFNDNSHALAFASQNDEMSTAQRSSGRREALRQLQHINELLWTHGCLDWVFVCAIVLNQPILVGRLALRSIVYRHAVQILDHWAQKECSGYRLFFQNVFSQLNSGLKLDLQAPPICCKALEANEVKAELDEYTSSFNSSKDVLFYTENQQPPAMCGSVAKQQFMNRSSTANRSLEAEINPDDLSQEASSDKGRYHQGSLNSDYNCESSKPTPTNSLCQSASQPEFLVSQIVSINDVAGESRYSHEDVGQRFPEPQEDDTGCVIQ